MKNYQIILTVLILISALILGLIWKETKYPIWNETGKLLEQAVKKAKGKNPWTDLTKRQFIHDLGLTPPLNAYGDLT